MSFRLRGCTQLVPVRHALRKSTKGTSSRCLNTAAERSEEYDVVIVGGGPAGLALAGALANSTVVRESTSVALIEAGDLSRIRQWSQPDGTFSNRVSSITNASQSFLKDIGAWSFVDDSRVGKLEGMEVWDGLSDARIQFSTSDLQNISPGNTASGATQIAHMTENLNIQRGLLQFLDKHPQIQLLDNVKVDAITPDEPDNGRWPIVRLSNGRALRARLLIGADGFNSPVKKYAGIRTYGWAYDTHAVVATMFHHPLYPGTPLTAYQRFLPTGPIALLPLSDTVSSLVWSTKPAIAAALKASHPDVLCRMINAAFRLPDVSLRVLNDMVLSSKDLSPEELADTIKWREEAHGIAPVSSLSSFGEGSAAVGGYGDEVELPPIVTSIQPGSVAGFPLRMSHAETYLGESAGARTALVGDAAHTVHPLAGQGLNMGLADVESLAKCIEDALTVGADIGSRTALAPYPKERYFENHKMISATDKLHKLYGTTWSPLVWARSVGLEVVNELDTIKAALMASAGSQPRRASSSPLWTATTMGIEGLAGLTHTAESVVRGAADLGAALLKGTSRR